MSFAFTLEGLDFLLEEFSWLDDFLHNVIDVESYNAFYLNALSVDSGGHVDVHVDCSLNHWLGCFRCADDVSVLYLSVPCDSQGGELVIYGDKGEVDSFQPLEGSIVRFPGKYPHSVRRFFGSDSRLSIVLESYRLSGELLLKVPGFFSFC